MLALKRAHSTDLKKKKNRTGTFSVTESLLLFPWQTVGANLMFIVRLHWTDHASTLASDTLGKNIKFGSVFIAHTKLYKIAV